ncbi:MAG: metal ABC transporter permease [Firmicutes bacterium]|nr:metal ABC transporter permease [[Eubacterium] siraeum]MCM1487687.1 metal ABC transporter permease [Bacillota bacterium]
MNVSVFSDYTFTVVALGCGMLGMISGVLGSFSVLRKESLLGDGVSHASLPGVVAAFLLTGVRSIPVLLTGALISGLLATFLINFTVKSSKLKFDAALAAVMSAFFGLGTVLLTCAQKLPDATQAGLDSFIYGQASAMLKSDVLLLSVSALILLLGVILLWKELKLFSFDRDFAVQAGFNERLLSAVLSLMTVLTIILGIQTVGVVLMSAMLIIPAAAARQWSDRLWAMVVLAAVFGSLSGAAGAYVSAVFKGIPTGPAIVVISGIIVVFSLLFAPKRGILKQLILRQLNRLKLTVTVEEKEE